MRKIIGLFFLILFISGCIAPTSVRTTRPGGKEVFPLAKDITIEQPQIRLPEFARLVYQVKWSGVPVGYLENTIKGTQKINGRDCYVLETVMKTNAFLSFIFPVNDRFTSYMDVEKKFAVRHEAVISEGKYRRNSVTDFDQEKHSAHFKNFLDNSEKDFEILPETQDVITAYYYLMLLPVTNVGDKIEFNGTNTGLKYALNGQITSKVFIRVPAFGSVQQNAFIVRMNLVPEIKGKKIEEGVSDVYFSTARERFPLYGVIKGPIFTEVTATLIKAEVKAPAALPLALQPPAPETPAPAPTPVSTPVQEAPVPALVPETPVAVTPVAVSPVPEIPVPKIPVPEVPAPVPAQTVPAQTPAQEPSAQVAAPAPAVAPTPAAAPAPAVTAPVNTTSETPEQPSAAAPQQK